MPDKPKRRKNNKNKRKNKGQNQQNSSTQLVSAGMTESEPREEKVLTPSSLNKQIELVTEQKVELPSAKTDVHRDRIGDESLLSGTQAAYEEKKENIILSETTFNSASETSDQGYFKKENKLENVTVKENYKVQSPEKTIKYKSKLQTSGKSKSVDNDDQPTIVEILDEEGKSETENSLVIVDASNVLVTEVDPEVKWENTNDLKDFKSSLPENIMPGALSVTTIPVIKAECEQTKSMSPEEERTLRKYLQGLNLSTNETIKPNIMEIKTEIEHIEECEIKKRLKNKGYIDTKLMPRIGPPRSLHVIDEEVSGESSATSRRHSYFNEKKDENDELEDDVFISCDDSQSKIVLNKDIKKITNPIPQQCIRVDAQIKDPEISEARGAWTTKKLESLTGAEIVYLTDSSSSTSSTYDINENEENNYKSDESVRIVTPTIEVINTANFLKNNFTSIDESCKEYQNLNEDQTNILQNNFEDVQQIGNMNILREHEIIVLDADNVKTNLYVKDIDMPSANTKEESNPLIFKEIHAKNEPNTKKVLDQYDLEIKVIKCELNDAINNLIKEVISDTENASEDVNESLVRQDSSSSIASSQCTAKYNPKCSSLNDVSGAESDEFSRTNNELKQSLENKSHVQDVIESMRASNIGDQQKEEILSLRDLSLKTICGLPYGEQIIEELAKVSERLQTMSDFAYATSNIKKTSNDTKENKVPVINHNVGTPPPITPRNSSLKISCEDSRNVLQNHEIPKSYNICLSPSQKMLMDKTKTTLENKDEDKNNVSRVMQKGKFDINKQVPDSKEVIDVPFKSQTGSRLLALLRKPPGKTDSIEPSMSKTNRLCETSSNLYSMLQTKDTNTVDNVNRTMSETVLNNAQKQNERSNMFKPIPPPKPRNLSSSFYESHQSSFMDNSFKSIKSENKYFHYSTGNLSKDIEDDISSIQDMHRYYNDVYKQARQDFYPRRPSLPKDLCDQQMEYILRKEKEVEAEIYRLENDHVKNTQRRGPRAPMISEKDGISQSAFDLNNHVAKSHASLNTLFHPPTKLEAGKLSSSFSKSEEELVRNKMYTEYVSQMAEREQRKQQKVIKITKTPQSLNKHVHSMSESQLKFSKEKVSNRIEKEFIDKARERWNKLGFRDPETEDEKETDQNYKEPQVMEHKIKVIDSGEEKEVQKLPNHLQDFVKFTVKDKSDKGSSPGESDHNEASSHGVVVCAVIILLLTIVKYIVRLFR